MSFGRVGTLPFGGGHGTGNAAQKEIRSGTAHAKSAQGACAYTFCGAISHPPPRALYTATRAVAVRVSLSARRSWASNRVRSASRTVRKSATPIAVAISPR